MNASSSGATRAHHPAPGVSARKQWHDKILEECRAIAGLPTLAALAAGIFYPEDKRVLAGTTAVALIIAVGLRFLPHTKFFSRLHGWQSLLTTLPWLLSAALIAILILVILPERTRSQNALLASTWLDWQKELEESASKCVIKKHGKSKGPPARDQQEKDEKELSACLAENLDPVLGKRPGRAESNKVTGLASDLLAGQLMLANSNIRDVLKLRLSTGKTFLGSGFSEPEGQVNYTEARVPEYLVPNLSDQSPRVWVWKFDPWKMEGQKTIEDYKLLDVLLHLRQPINHADFNQIWDSMKEEPSASGTPSVLVRFALFKPETNDSGCLGRAEATRVFMSSLSEVKDKTAREAAKNSGWLVPGQNDNSGRQLVIWVYAPTDEGDVIPATWGNVLDNFKTWIKDEACAKTP
jgi:hypothetical protein